MKPVPFEYRRAGSVPEACALLAGEPGTLLIAGGQTLMPMLAMRLARPRRVVDILRIPDLDAIRVGDSHVEIGAAARQISVEHSPVVAAELPLLARALPFVGHAATRRRGTVGGSVANADPAAEIALCAVALEAEILLAGDPAGRAALPAAAFFLGPMTTALPQGAMVTGLRFPRRDRGRRSGSGFREIARRHADYALAAAAAVVTLDPSGACAAVSVAVGGATPVPTRLDLSALPGRHPADGAVREAIAAALEPLEMMHDPNAGAAYRRRALLALATAAVADAAAAAREGAG
jgi:CO/xanthine dehydrogenase FAD-binding subunit